MTLASLVSCCLPSDATPRLWCPLLQDARLKRASCAGADVSESGGSGEYGPVHRVEHRPSSDQRFDARQLTVATPTIRCPWTRMPSTDGRLLSRQVQLRCRRGDPTAVGHYRPDSLHFGRFSNHHESKASVGVHASLDQLTA